MEEAKIVLDRKSFEALAADTRVKILKSLSKRRKTLSELASELKMSVSGIKEHLETLENAELVEKIDDGHKWKYYELTKKGDGIIAPHHKGLKIMLLLSISVLIFLSTTFMLFFPFNPGSSMLLSEKPNEIVSSELPVAERAVVEEPEMLVGSAPDIEESIASGESMDAELETKDLVIADIESENQSKNATLNESQEVTSEEPIETTQKSLVASPEESTESLEEEIQENKERSEVPLLVVIAVLSLGTILVCISELTKIKRY